LINLDSLESSTETSEILTDEQIFNLVSKEDETLLDAEPEELIEETKIKTADAKNHIQICLIILNKMTFSLLKF